jgi:hypothetical protein
MRAKFTPRGKPHPWGPTNVVVNRPLSLVLNGKVKKKPWLRGLVLLSPPVTEETGAMGREIETRKGIGR